MKQIILVAAICGWISACGGGTGGGNATTAPPAGTTPPPSSPDAPPTLTYGGQRTFELGYYASGAFTQDALTSFSVNPALPPGLTIVGDGSFGGVPSATSAPTSYTFLAGNSKGTTPITVQLEVVAGPLFYPNPVSVAVGSPMPALAPQIVGTFGNFTVTPALPDGLTLDPNSGVISGTPRGVTAPQMYEITARDSLSAVTFGILLGTEAAATTPVTATKFLCAYSGGFVGTYQGISPDDSYGLVAVTFTPDGIGHAQTDELALNAGLNGSGGTGLNPVDATFEIDLLSNTTASLKGNFLGTDWIEGEFKEGSSRRHFTAARIGGSTAARTRFTSVFASPSSNYPLGFAVIDEDASGKLTGLKYQLGTGFDTLHFAHVTEFAGTISGASASIDIDGQGYLGKYSASLLTMQVGDPYDTEAGPFENGSSYFRLQGCQLN